MATAAATSPPHRPRRAVAPPSSPPPTTLARAPSARAAATSRIATTSGPSLRKPVVKSASPVPQVTGETRESLAASLKHETDQKEQLLVQLQDKDQLINTYLEENGSLTSALSSAETRVNELYTEQARWEAELAQRIEVADKLREQVRELEKEKRDVQRRYNEQTATFDAERQAFYDNEQHLKSRIQSLTQARKRSESMLSRTVEVESEYDPEPASPMAKAAKLEGESFPVQQYTDPDYEPAEMTALRLELSTLSTSYASLQSTIGLMQSQLVDLKRVNQELQEENESYMILLRERTLNGQFDLSRQINVADSEDGSEENLTDSASTRSQVRTTLHPVQEEPHESLAAEINLAHELDLPVSSRASRHSRKRTMSTPLPRGETLADLPITGPGLDLAAELGRAENKDILEGNIDERNNTMSRRRKNTIRPSESSGMDSVATTTSNADIENLRTEVKNLKDANKALSLYASKIIDRIIAQEGFEHVLAADYEKEKASSTASSAAPVARSNPPQQKSRPQSVIVGKSFATTPLEPKVPESPVRTTQHKTANRRSLSFDWKGFSLFSEKKPETPANLRPLTLKPGSASVVSARKLETTEDDEDRKERERLHATMKLMGIVPSPLPSPIAPSIERTASAPSMATPATAKPTKRFSFFGSRADPVETSSLSSNSSSLQNGTTAAPLGLTQEALERAEAESSLAALDARERDLSAEIAKGASGGFTEVTPRSSRRNRRSAGGSGSGSTVWSAGMSGHGDE